MGNGLAGRRDLQHVEFLLEQALRRVELENLARDAIEMFDVHLEVERVDSRNDRPLG